MISLSNKRILVTGASSGIGKEVSKLAASLGASLILIGRDINRLKETLNSLQGHGHEYYSADVTDYSKIDELIRSSVKNHGAISGFVHSAGIEKTLPFKASTPKLFKEVFETNVFSGYEIARILSQKNMFDTNGTSFVFISSIMGRIGTPGKIVYCSSKSALLAGAKAMALELAPKKIRCNCVLPGIVETEMVKKSFEILPEEAKNIITAQHPLGLGKPEDIASLIVFLLSDHSKWITGSEYIIDGGYSAQ